MFLPIAVPFSPIQYAPKVWLDMADTSTITQVAGAVSQINDKSGNGNNFVQGTGSAQPTTNSATINSRNILVFDGGDSLLRTLSSDITGTAMTAFIVAKRTSAVGFSGTFSGVTNGELNDFDNVGSLVFYNEQATGVVIESYNNNVSLSSSTNPGDAAAYIATTKFDGTNNTAYLNNAAQTPVACTSTLSFHTLCLGSRYVGGGATAGYNGAIAEVLLYNTALSAAAIQQVNIYLSKKWGIAIS